MNLYSAHGELFATSLELATSFYWVFSVRLLYLKTRRQAPLSVGNGRRQHLLSIARKDSKLYYPNNNTFDRSVGYGKIKCYAVVFGDVRYVLLRLPCRGKLDWPFCKTCLGFCVRGTWTLMIRLKRIASPAIKSAFTNCM